MTESANPFSSLHNFPAIPPVPGVELGAIAAGLNPRGGLDLMMAHFSAGTVAAGLFTNSAAPAAPVHWSRDVLARNPSRIRALIVNAGNANSFTGRRGLRTAQIMAESASHIAGCQAHHVLVASTGIMGEILAPGPLRKGIRRLEGGLSSRLYKEAADAIKTTDQFPKGAFRIITQNGHPITVAGIAKGSTMIAPNMGTVLAFIFTSARISAPLLNELLTRAARQSFNAIMTDGDTATNDSLLAFATGATEQQEISSPTDPGYAELERGVCDVCMDLAHQVIADGLGTGKFITIKISGAESDEAAKHTARHIASSTMVKVALGAGKPYWAAVLASAAGAGTKVDSSQMQLWLGEQLVAHHGAVHLRYKEEDAKAHLAGDQILVHVDLGVGEGSTQIWTTGLGPQYHDKLRELYE